MRSEKSEINSKSYNHQTVMAEIDKINKDLQQLKDGLVTTSGELMHFVHVITSNLTD